MILMAVPVEGRYALPGSEFMIHAARSGNAGKRNKRTRAVDKEYAQLIAENTRVNPDDLKKLMGSGRDRYLGVNEALELGIVGAVIQP